MICATQKGGCMKAWLLRLYYLMYEVVVNMNKMVKQHWVYVFIELKNPHQVLLTMGQKKKTYLKCLYPLDT